jgi:formyltetrahydrofolate hydrolase
MTLLNLPLLSAALTLPTFTPHNSPKRSKLMPASIINAYALTPSGLISSVIDQTALLYNNGKNIMQKQAFKKRLNQNKMMRAAAKVASRTQNQEVATNVIHDAADGKILKKDAHTLVKEVLGLTDQEFLDQVRNKLSVMVNESLDTLHRKIDDIPAHHLAFAVNTLISNYMTVSGRPSTITANANVKLGASAMTPTQVREVLKSGKMRVVQDENAQEASED